ncbi:PREDICTED: uncharacterized protein LOC106344195 [Brassica oleracea var. oleracea]|uniref:uncharacterized protein LOC106344195 n=1 Tax=Brassica oleracea var. oleracea TaxID=109376 RepID=UPI0006A6FB3D|nr:PREDICTED: uncharacterized protein LOC106344195 [Brassica oleracea var. oleracea]
MKELNRVAASELDDSSSLASPYMCHGLDPQYLTPGFIPLNHRSHQLSGLASFQSSVSSSSSSIRSSSSRILSASGSSTSWLFVSLHNSDCTSIDCSIRTSSSSKSFLLQILVHHNGEELVYRASCNEGEANLRGSLARAERRSQDFSDFCRFLQFFKITGCLTGFSTVVISRSITGVNALPHAVPVVSLKSLTHSVVLRVCCLPISGKTF